MITAFLIFFFAWSFTFTDVNFKNQISVLLPSWIWLRLRGILSIKLLLVKGNSENTLKSGLLILMPLEWSLLISFCIKKKKELFIFYFDIINLAPMSFFGRCVRECVCMSACLFRCWVGEGGTWVGFVVVLVLSVGWGWDLFGKMPCDLRHPYLL